MASDSIQTPHVREKLSSPMASPRGQGNTAAERNSSALSTGRLIGNVAILAITFAAGIAVQKTDWSRFGQCTNQVHAAPSDHVVAAPQSGAPVEVLPMSAAGGGFDQLGGDLPRLPTSHLRSHIPRLATGNDDLIRDDVSFSQHGNPETDRRNQDVDVDLSVVPASTGARNNSVQVSGIGERSSLKQQHSSENARQHPEVLQKPRAFVTNQGH